MDFSSQSTGFTASKDELEFMKTLPVDTLPSIACVVPSFNQGAFLARTLDSILGQNYPNLEIFVADGGSADNSVDVLKDYSMRFSQILKFDSAPDGGHSQGVIKGIEHTKGDIIAWINSDDVYLPQTFWKIATFFYFNRCALVVYGGSDYVDANLKKVCTYPTKWTSSLCEMRRIMKHYCPIPQPSLFFRREALQLGGNPRQSSALDYELWMRWMKYMPFYYYNDILTQAVVHSDAISVKADSKLLINTCREVHQYYDFVPMSWCCTVAYNSAYGATWAKGKYPPFTIRIKCHAVFLFCALNLVWIPKSLLKIFSRLYYEMKDNIKP